MVTDPSKKDHTFGKRVGAFASATLISRILGYARDALVARAFGGGLETDAFYAAFKIPNLLRRFLGEGALTAAFVPVFTETLNREGHQDARRLLNALFSTMLFILFFIVVLGIWFAPQVTMVVSYGFTLDPDKFELTVRLTRLMFPFLLFVSCAALMAAVLNATGKFFIPAVAPSGLSVGEIAFIVFLASRVSNPIEGLAISAVVGVFLHFVWQIPSLFRQGFALQWARPFSHPQVKTVFLLMGPTLIGLCADQVNSFVDQFCASFLQHGSITALYNSNRIMQLPLALFGVAVSSVALPSLAKASSDNDLSKFKELLAYSIRLANYVLIPSLIGLAVLGLPIVQMLFQHGKFTYDQSLLTYRALVPYALGLPAYSMVRIFASAFYAQKDTRTPVIISFWAMFLHVVLNVILMRPFDVAGLAFATTVSAWFQAGFLFLKLRQKAGILGGKAMWRSFVVATALSVVMAFVCWLSQSILFGFTPMYFRTIFSIVLGVCVYLYFSKVFGVPEFEDFLNVLRKRKSQGTA